MTLPKLIKSIAAIYALIYIGMTTNKMDVGSGKLFLQIFLISIVLFLYLIDVRNSLKKLLTYLASWISKKYKENQRITLKPKTVQPIETSVGVTAREVHTKNKELVPDTTLKKKLTTSQLPANSIPEKQTKPPENIIKIERFGEAYLVDISLIRCSCGGYLSLDTPSETKGICCHISKAIVLKKELLETSLKCLKPIYPLIEHHANSNTDQPLGELDYIDRHEWNGYKIDIPIFKNQDKHEAMFTRFIVNEKVNVTIFDDCTLCREYEIEKSQEIRDLYLYTCEFAYQYLNPNMHINFSELEVKELNKKRIVCCEKNSPDDFTIKHTFKTSLPNELLVYISIPSWEPSIDYPKILKYNTITNKFNNDEREKYTPFAIFVKNLAQDWTRKLIKEHYNRKQTET